MQFEKARFYLFSFNDNVITKSCQTPSTIFDSLYLRRAEKLGSSLPEKDYLRREGFYWDKKSAGLLDLRSSESTKVYQPCVRL